MPAPRFARPLTLSRPMWDPTGPRGQHPLRLPVPDVFLHHTVTPVTDDPLADARAVARVGEQRFGRLSYSVLVHPARVIFWGDLDRVGAHTAGHNSSSIAIALIGNYEKRRPADELIYDACYALHSLRAYGIVTGEPNVRAHRAVASTACPGLDATRSLLPVLRLVARTPGWSP